MNITVNRKEGHSSADIERMVREAEELAEQDKAAREKIDARNGLENYAYQVKNAVNDEEKVGSKVSADDKKKVNDAIKEALDWLEEAGAEATAESLNERRQSLEKIVNPIMEAVYKAGGGAGGPGGAGGAGGGDEAPETDEL